MAITLTRVKIDRDVGTSIVGARIDGRYGVFWLSGNTIYARYDGSGTSGFLISTDSGATWESVPSLATLSGTSWSMTVDKTNNTIVAYRALDVGSHGEIETRRYNFGTDAWDVIGDTTFNDEPATSYAIFEGGSSRVLHESTVFTDNDLHFGEGDNVVFTDNQTEYGGLTPSFHFVEADDDGFSHIIFHVDGGTNRQFSGTDLATVYHMHNRSGSFSAPVAVRDESGSHLDNHSGAKTTLVSGNNGNLYVPIIANDASSVQRLYLCTYSVSGDSWSDELVDSEFMADNTGTIACQVDSQGTIYILVVGQVASVTTNATVYAFKKPSSGSWERTVVDDTNEDVGLGRVSNGNRGEAIFKGAFFLVRGDWDSSTIEYFFVSTDLELVDEGDDGSIDADSVTVVAPLPDVPRRQRIPFDIPTTSARLIQPPPGVEGREVGREIREIGEWLRHAYDFIRFEIDDHSSRITQIAESLPGDRKDEFDFVSSGDSEEELTIVHNLGYVPRNLVLISQSDPGLVSLARDTLGDNETLFVKSTHPAGARIRVRVY